MSRTVMTPGHFERIAQSEDHHQLCAVAKDVLALLGDPVGMVCGPISTGGLGTVEANIQRFNEAIDALLMMRVNIFDQMPFEPKLAELHEPGESGYDWRILNHFYEPLFLTGKIKIKFFIPGWESSTGARWERQQADKLGIKVIYLNHNLLPIW